MADEGPNNPGTVVEDDTIGLTGWSSEDNAKVSDNSYAQAQVGGNP